MFWKIIIYSEEVISDIRDRQQKENNLIVYNLPDFKNAQISDLHKFIGLLGKSSEVPSFSFDGIEVFRWRNKFNANAIRPFEVALPSNESVNWVFHQKKSIKIQLLFWIFNT